MRRWHSRTVHIQARILLLPFCPPVLEPDFYLEGWKVTIKAQEEDILIIA